MGNPRLAFLVMSAVARPGTVDQLASALAPHPVLVHHDFTQSPDFTLRSPNVRWVPDPRRTGWANFGFVEGIFHSMRFALEHVEFDYFQLLSPTCLPVRPMRDFEAHAGGPCDAHFDCIELMHDRDALMSVGYRAFTPQGTLRHRVLRRLSGAYFGDSSGRRDEAGIWLHAGAAPGLTPWVAHAAVSAFAHPLVGRHIFDEGLRPYCGSTWFGARRDVVASLVSLFSQSRIHDYFSRLRIADEFLFPTLLMHLGVRKGPMNHYIQRYDGAHTGSIQEPHIPQVRQSRAFFARKFPDDPHAMVRWRVLKELAGVRDPGLSVFSAAAAS
jgi:hypothetical protein